MEPTHYDLVVVLAVLFGLGLAIVGFVAGVLVSRILSRLDRSRDMTRAVGAMVLQEADKIRALVAQQR
jgi:cytochrome c biogenesis protein CcdA